MNSLGLRRKTDRSRDNQLFQDRDQLIAENAANGAAENARESETVNSAQSNDKYSSDYNSISSSTKFSSSSSSSYNYKSVKRTQTSEEYLEEKIRSKRDQESVDIGDSDSSDIVSRRRRRDAEGRISPDHIIDAEGRLSRVVTFDCGRGTAKCLSISCDIPRLGRGEHAIIRY